jgi:hypothetical protein
MLLAAGRGERMRPLTDTTPKPLLPVQGKPLMQWPLEALARSGCTRAVVNTAWLGEQIPQTFGDHFRLQPSSNGPQKLSNQEHSSAPMPIRYSHEGLHFGGALETAGGIARALPLLGEVFWVVAGDVFAPDFDFPSQAVDDVLASAHLAHRWLVPDPAHNPKGDFGLESGLALNLARRPAATLHLQHHGPVPPRAVRGALVRHSRRQPGRREGCPGPPAAHRHGPGAHQRHAVHRPLGRCGNTRTLDATQRRNLSRLLINVMVFTPWLPILKTRVFNNRRASWDGIYQRFRGGWCGYRCSGL